MRERPIRFFNPLHAAPRRQGRPPRAGKISALPAGTASSFNNFNPFNGGQAAGQFHLGEQGEALPVCPGGVGQGLAGSCLWQLCFCYWQPVGFFLLRSMSHGGGGGSLANGARWHRYAMREQEWARLWWTRGVASLNPSLQAGMAPPSAGVWRRFFKKDGKCVEEAVRNRNSGSRLSTFGV
jgi:hypothetical protein